MTEEELQEEISKANRALIHARRAAESQAKNRQRQIHLIEELLSLGRLRVAAGEIPRGVSCYREAVDRSKDSVLDYTASDEFTWCIWMGYCLDVEGALPEARDFYEDAIAIAEKNQLDDNERTGIVFNNLAMVYRQMDDDDNAAKNYQLALESFSTQKGLRSIEVADVLHNLGVLSYFGDRYTEAIEYFRQALSIRTDQLPDNHEDICQCYANLAALYKRIGNDEEAKLYYDHSTKYSKDEMANYEIMVSRKMDGTPQ